MKTSWWRNLMLALLGMSSFCISPFAANEVRLFRTPDDGAVPDAETDGSGAIHLAYVMGEDVFYAKSTNLGTSFSKPIRVNSEPGTAHPANMFRGPDVAVGKDGRIHVIWYVNAYQRKLPKNQWGVFYSHLDPVQGTFVPAVNLNHQPSDNYSLAADRNGNVAVIWMAEKLFVNNSTNSGESFAASVWIGNADPCECCASRAAYSSAGALLIEYRDKASNIRDMHLLARAFNDHSFRKEKISDTPWAVAGCPMTGGFLARGRNEELVAWETKGQIFYSRIDSSTGQRKTKEIKVAEQGKWPVIIGGLDDNVLVSWKNDGRTHWRIFNRTDQPTGAADSKKSPNSTRHAGVTANGMFLLID